MNKRGLSQLEKVNFTKPLTSEVFHNFKNMMYDQKVVLYDWPREENSGGETTQHCDYIAELLTLQATYHSEYVTTVKAPNVRDAHDDLSDALVRMVHLASQELGNRKYISGVSTTAPQAQALKLSQHRLATAQRQALRQSRFGGSSPDRQRSRLNRGQAVGRSR